jgi:A/G-specific adenine glycosylase
MNKRDLPWRHTRDPYKIAVSEIMLQQTQVLRVIPKYCEFIERYPTVADLAKSSVAEVLRLWKGMGYNRRALYLHKLAQEIVTHYSGKFPKDEKSLITLPGLGTYTARAIMVFAYGEQVAPVDTNIRQIITHFFFEDVRQRPEVIESVARQLVPNGKSWEWHQALMDYGALELKVSGIKYQVSGKKQEPFRDSNRFYRGRIMDLLREGNVKDVVLLKTCIEKYNKAGDFFINIIEGLRRDGLVKKTRHIFHLPK